MNIMNFRNFIMGTAVFLGLILSACSTSQDPTVENGTGRISLGVTTSTAFSRAVTESDYSNVNNYTVQILDNEGEQVQEFQYGEKPENITLKNGSYTLKAFYGTEHEASRNEFYVEGSTSFSVAGDEKQVTVDCYPTCGKVAVKFASNMDESFSDYSVVYKTNALTAAGKTAVWAKGDSEPWYLKVDKAGETVTATIQVTRVSDSKSATVERTYTLAPGKSWTLNIAPADENGGLGISITVDETTDDEEIDIEVPSDWL